MKITKYPLVYSSDNDLYLKMLDIMNILLNWEITEDQKKILTFYMRFGYSRRTKELILEETKIKSIDSLNTQNYTMRGKGLLVESKRNKNVSELSEELIKIKDFIENKSKGFLVEIEEI